MKRTVTIAVSLFFVSALLVAMPVKEEPAAVVKMAVLAGPTGFSSAALDNYLNEESFELAVYPSPNEVIARLANGELDIAALPSNVAANLYNKGVAIKVAAVIGDGMLSVLSTDASITTAADVLGKSVNIPGAGSTPDQMAQLLLQEANLKVGVDVELDYSVAAPAQLAQMLIANKVSLAMLPEPFVTMVSRQNPRVQVALDVQEVYSDLTGVENYPMSVLVVSSGFATEQPKLLAQILAAYSDSVEWVVSNPSEAGAKIEAAGIMAAAMATAALPYCNLVYRPAAEAQGALDAYYRFLYSFNPEAIGLAVPAKDLYL